MELTWVPLIFCYNTGVPLIISLLLIVFIVVIIFILFIP